MASTAWSGLARLPAIKTVASSINILPVRFRTHRNLPTKKRIRPFMQRRTDFIKQLVVALVQHERVQTTLPKANQLKKYGDLLITMAQRRRPPPDVDMIKDGFVLTEREASENMVQRKIVNRKSKKVVVLPQTLTEKDYVARLKKEARNMLMGNQDALDKVYGPLKERYIDRYGGFVRIVKIPHPPNSIYPRMAYVEFVDNKLPPMPELPVIEGGRMRVYSKQTEEQEHCEAAVAVG